MRHAIASSLLCLALAACGGGPPSAPAAGAAPAATQQAIARAGDVTMRASVLQTSTLDAGVARRYGIERSDRLAMLLVSVRRGPEGAEASMPARVEAKVSNLGGQAELLQLRELRSGDLLDYVGTVAVEPPDTLRFDVRIVREDGGTSDMQFTREFFPR